MHGKSAERRTNPRISLLRRGHGISSIRAIVFSIGIFDALHLDLVVVDDRVAARGSPSRGNPTLPGLSTTTAIDLDVELHVRVAHADDVGFDVLQPLGPDFGSFSRYSSSGSRGVAWTIRNRLPPSVNRCVTGNCRR